MDNIIATEVWLMGGIVNNLWLVSPVLHIHIDCSYSLGGVAINSISFFRIFHSTTLLLSFFHFVSYFSFGGHLCCYGFHRGRCISSCGVSMIELSVLFHINLYFRSVLKMRLFSPSHSPLSCTPASPALSSCIS